MQNKSLLRRRKILFSLCKFIAVAIGGQGGFAPFWFTKNTFFEALRYKKIDNDAKRSNI